MIVQAGRSSCGIPLGRYSSCYMVLPEGLNFFYVYNLHINSVASRLSWEIVSAISTVHLKTTGEISVALCYTEAAVLDSYSQLFCAVGLTYSWGSVWGQGAEVLPCVVELRGSSFSVIGFTHGTLEIKCTFPLYSILQKFTLHLLQNSHFKNSLLCKYIK